MIPVRGSEGKRVAVFGLGRTGLTAARALVAGGAQVALWDEKPASRAAAAAEGFPVVDLQAADWSHFDALMLSPGVPLTHPDPHWTVTRARDAGVEIVGDIELFARTVNAAPEHKRPKVVVITGTNGKSTTTALVHHLLRSAAVPTRMGGNIGLPVLGQDPLPAGGVYVLELSSYQIDLTYNLACDVACLLNVMPDHLDRYDGFAAYAASKARLFAMQHANQIAVFGMGDTDTLSVAAREEERRGHDCIKRVDEARITAMQADWPTLQGPHNLQNAAAAVAIVEALGLTEGQWRPAMKTFRGLPHRMERVAEAHGVLFINDSKATNPASTAPALAAFPPHDHRRIHWILGGLPKGDRLDECQPYFGNVAAAYTIGEAGPRFADLLEPYMPVQRSEMMCEAIRQAIDAAGEGDVVLLSPACASFDQFRDYEARGDTFRQLVDALLEGGSC